MVPRADIVAVSVDTDLDTLKEKFIETGISRILVLRMISITLWDIFICGGFSIIPGTGPTILHPFLSYLRACRLIN